MVILRLLILLVGFAAAKPLIKGKVGYDEIIPDYIVVFKSGFDLVEATSDVVKQFTHFKVIPRLEFVYKKIIHGIALKGVSQEAVDWLEKQEYVDYVEKSVEFSQNACTVSPTSIATYKNNKVNWGLDRITETRRTLDYHYAPSGRGRGAVIYVVDSGIQSNHDEFKHNPNGVSAVDHPPVVCENSFSHHGTRVAGVAAGKVFGTARDATLKDVRIGCKDSASSINLVRGFDEIVDDVTSRDNCVVVVSYTLDTNLTSVYTAVKTVQNMCILVAAAGNERSSYMYFPAGYSTEMSNVISVGAINARRRLPCYSNYGPSVDIYAPGSNIWTADSSSASNKIAKVSGTSFAAPFVAGVAAIHMGLGVSLDNVKQTILQDATTSPTIVGLPDGSHSRILYVN